jgi:hypothetical protein
MRAGVAQIAKPLDVGNRLLARPVGVGLTVLFGCRNHRSDLGNPRRQRFVDAALVERQRNAVRAWKRGHSPDNIAHIGKLRKGARRQKRSDLEMPHTRAVFFA